MMAKKLYLGEWGGMVDKANPVYPCLIYTKAGIYNQGENAALCEWCQNGDSADTEHEP